MKMTDRKKTTKQALESYLNRTAATSRLESRRKNKKPEEQFALEIQGLLSKIGFQVVRVESRAVFSAAAGRYLNSQAKAGTPDILCCSTSGIFCAIELKAPGRRSTLKPHQRDFLMQTISRGGFACCTDSTEHFLSLWNSWYKSPNQKILVADLPKAPSGANTDQPLFGN